MWSCHDTFFEPWYTQQWGRQSALPVVAAHLAARTQQRACLADTVLLFEQREKLEFFLGTGGSLVTVGRRVFLAAHLVSGFHQCRCDRHPLMSPP